MHTLSFPLNIHLIAETTPNEVQTILIDCSSVIFVDVAGAKLFIQVQFTDSDADSGCFDFFFIIAVELNCECMLLTIYIDCYRCV